MGKKQSVPNVVSVRLSSDDLTLLEGAVDAVGVIPRSTLVRIALRLGLETIRADPTKALLKQMAVEAKRKKK